MEESLPERIFGTTFALVCDPSTLFPVLPILTYGCGLPSAALVRITSNTYCCILTTACSERKCGTGFTEGTWSILHAKGRIDWIAQDISWRSVRKVQLENEVECWAFSSSQYVQAAVKNVEEYLATRNNERWKLPGRAETQMRTAYRPELDVSPELGPNGPHITCH